MEKMIVLQVIAHLLADFTFQPEKWCKSKLESGFQSKYLYIHTVIVFTCSWFFSFSLQFVWLALLVAVIHFVCDGLKSITERIIIKKNNSGSNSLLTFVFIVDQLIHLIVIILVSCLYTRVYGGLWFAPEISLQLLLIIMGYILCLKPANVIIQSVLHSYSLLPINNQQEDSDLEKAGRLIGNLERILAFTLALLSQYGAIGFIIAAKSILRYKQGDVKKTEYVLIGTLLSFSIAILLEILITKVLLI